MSIDVKIEILSSNIEVATKMQQKLMKSRVQTYDIRDSPEYRGVFEIETVLQKVEESVKIDKSLASIIKQKFNETTSLEKRLNQLMMNRLKKEFNQ